MNNLLWALGGAAFIGVPAGILSITICIAAGNADREMEIAHKSLYTSEEDK